MSRKYFYIIPLFLMELMLQMLFFWLAPGIASRWTVYTIVTVMTIAHLALTYTLVSLNGIRRSAATVIAGSFIQLLLIGAAVFLLATDAAIRSSLFMLMIISLLYVTVVTLLGLYMENGETIQNRNDMPGGNGGAPIPSIVPYEENTCTAYRSTPVQEPLPYTVTRQMPNAERRRSRVVGNTRAMTPPPLPND